MEIVQALGQLPPWVELGPPDVVAGLDVRRVLGSWPGRGPYDQLPDYVADGVIPAECAVGHDRSEERAPIKQARPGRSIAELKGIHRGAVAILFNGPSLATHDLSRIKVPIIGMNRTFSGSKSYAGPEPDYLCIVEDLWLRNEHVRKHPGLINGSLDERPIGYRATRSFRMAPFSFDLERDGFVNPVPCTTGHLALQVAVYMGFTTLYCLGLDLTGGHFDGTDGSQHYTLAKMYHRRQVDVLAKRGIDVYVCGSPNSRAPFSHAPFEAVCGASALDVILEGLAEGRKPEPIPGPPPVGN